MSSVLVDDILRLSAEHIQIVLASVAIASAIAIPAGIAAHRLRAVRTPALLLSSAIQTVPSLALFGFLIPFVGIGRTTALIALVLYALLPIIRNTVTGLLSVDRGVVDVSKAIGLKPSELLRYVELPLATPTIFAGIRMAGCRQQRDLAVGSKNFTEQVVLGEIIAQHLEKRLQRKVDRRLNLGGTIVVHSAIMGGAIDVYPEYTYTALSAIMKMNMLNNDAQGIQERVREVYNQTYRLDALPPLGFNNSFVIAVTKATADKYKLRTISDAEKVQDTWVLGVGYEFEQRPDGLPALNAKYDVQTRSAPMTMDLGLLYKALEQRQVNMIAASATDAQLTPAIKVLADDRHAFGPYQAFLVVSQDGEKKFPGMKKALEELSGKISEEEMRRMNYEVDIQKAQPATVAAAFLRKLP